MSGELNVQNLGKSYRQWGSEWRRIRYIGLRHQIRLVRALVQRRKRVRC